MTFLVHLVLLLLAVFSFGACVDLEDGVVVGILRNKDNKKCISVERALVSTVESKEEDVLRLQLRETYCPKVFQLATNGLIVESGTNKILHSSTAGSIYLFSEDLRPSSYNQMAPIHASVREFDGIIFFDNGQKCIGPHDDRAGRDLVTWLNPYVSTDSKCRDRKSRFRLVSSGMSWFSSDSLKKADRIDVRNNICKNWGRRLCFLDEICPPSPDGQSPVSVTAEGRKTALLVAGDVFVDAATCETVSDGLSSYSVDGFLCCPTDTEATSSGSQRSPRKSKVEKRIGFGHLVHKSGKCVDYVGNVLSLSDDCQSKTGLFSWSRDGSMKQGRACVIPQSLGKCPRFQFSDGNSLQDQLTGKCLVPDEGGMSPVTGAVLVEKAECGEDYASFVLKKPQGYLKHSSSKCVGVIDENKLVLQDACDLFEQVFHKDEFSKSFLIHAASGKCVGKPSEDGQALTLVTNCKKSTAAKLTFDGETFGYSGGSKCLKAQGDGLVVATGCSDEASKFQFADAKLCDAWMPSCKCAEGYEKHVGHCFPINRCKDNNGGCLGNAECLYTGPGTSMCACPPGYQLNSDGINCDECPEKNCYRPCQFIDYNELKTILANQDHVEVRFINVKTSDLEPYLGSTTELVVYTHQITISGTLTIPEGLERLAIFANEIIREDGAQIVLWNSARSGRSAVVKVENNKLMCANRYSTQWVGVVKGTVFNLYTSKTSAPFSCSGNYNSKEISIQAAIKSKENPKRSLDAELYSIMLNCAKVKAQGAPFSKDGKLLKGSFPVALIEYVLNDIRSAKEEELDTNTVNELRLNAKNLMEDLSIRASGIHRVPYLSLKAHEKILVLIKDDAKMAIQKYERFERISQDIDDRIEATDSMTELMTTIVRHNDLEVESLKVQLEAAKSDFQAMKKKLDEAKTALETAKEIFADGVRQFRNKMIANAVFSVISGVAGIFSAGAGSVVGFTIDLADLASDVGKLQKSMFKIGVIMDSITNIADAASAFTENHYDVIPYAGLEVSDYYSKLMPELQKDKSLAVMVLEWDVFATEADAYLSVGTASEISGASDYLAALNTVAIWGKGYHEKAITVQTILSTLTQLKTLQKDQNDATTKIKTSRENAKKEKRINGGLLTEMALQKQRLRNIMIDKLMLFCDSYFYNWLSDCPVMPAMADDLYALHEKVNQGLSAVINAVENFAPFIPQEFEATVILKDDRNCNVRKRRSVGGEQQMALNTLECPVSELKRGKEFLFKLDEKDPIIFRGHERIHVEEIEVYLDGAKFDRTATAGVLKQVVTVWISFTGMMTDVFRGKRYQFLAPPRITEFSYRIHASNKYRVTQYGKVSSKFQEFYDGIAAITTWRVTVPDSANRPNLNLEEVYQIKIKIKGTRVPIQPPAKKKPRSDVGQILGAEVHKGNTTRENHIKKRFKVNH